MRLDGKISTGTSINTVLQEAVDTFPALHIDVQNFLLGLVPLQLFFLNHGLNFQDKLKEVNSSKASRTLQTFNTRLRSI